MTRKTYNEARDQTSMRSLETYRDWTRRIIREWRAYLNGNELHVLLFIADRTIGWGKQWEVIKRRHFLNGVETREGLVVAQPVPFGARTLDTTLKSLESRGFIIVRVSGTRTLHYSLNYEFMTPDPPPKRGMRQPKKKRENQSSIAQRIAQRSATHCATPLRTPLRNIIEDKEEEEQIVKSSATPRRASPPDARGRDAVKDELETAASIARKNKLARLRASRFDGVYTIAALTEFWNDASDGKRTVRKRDFVILQQYNRRWAKAHSGDDFLEFLQSSVQNWTLILSYWLAWMTKAPVEPSVPFFVKRSDDFEDAWLRRESLRELGSLTRYERLVRRVMEEGMSEEAAHAHVCKKFNVAKDKETNKAAQPSMTSLRKKAREVAQEEQRERKRRRSQRREARQESDNTGSFGTWGANDDNE